MSMEHPSVHTWGREHGLSPSERIHLLTEVLKKTPQAPEPVGPEASPSLRAQEVKLKGMRDKILQAMAAAVVAIAGAAEVSTTVLEAVGQSRPDATESMAEILAKVEEERREAAKKHSSTVAQSRI